MLSSALVTGASSPRIFLRIERLFGADDIVLDRGTAVAKIAAENIKEHADLFHPILNLWVFEEIVNGEKLSIMINSRKENVKYLPGP